MSNSNQNKPLKSANPSGVTQKEYAEVLGGIPPKKRVEEFEPKIKGRGQGSAPGSVRK
jgi:hypothetical protein